ncbi:hypothetical protein CISIN_1g003622mg [Citrus sinensis]|uniref:DUF676 domain-containing protein n=2 Tax=Citrus sinensis TaxID=2711 RepID=A0A067EHH5_CITSI|nr:hypothetical protein CISIN_1g003622mg [Citrus sinensis]
MFRRLKWFVGKNWSTKRLPNADFPNPNLPPPPPPPQPTSPPPPPAQVTIASAAAEAGFTLDAVQEIAIYIHRFHNLDLFQQGWYQIKITLRWEDSEYSSSAVGTPARVVQYEAPQLGFDDFSGVWRIDDAENSFSTQPFRIKYARQDVHLSVMIAFNLYVSKYEVLSTSAVILKFELMYASVLENSPDLQSSLDACPAAVHEFRIPPKALLGLHSYCPVHFDSLHAVLVDVSVHVSLLKASSSTAPPKSEFVAQKIWSQLASVDSTQLMLIKALFSARDILLEDLKEISKAIDQAIDLDDMLFGSMDGEVPVQLLGMPQNGVERKADGAKDLQSDGLSHSLPWDDLLNAFHTLGNQILYLWNTFLMFHRANRRKIMEYLRDAWASDRRAEWSIWMVYSKVELPHHFISSRVDESSYPGTRGKALSLRKFGISDDPAQSAAMRAELHRRSIAQMRINNRSLQDMYIFGDPSSIPIVIVDRVVQAPLHKTSGNSYFCHPDQRDNPGVHSGHSSEAVKKSTGASSQQCGRVLKIVVFVHGFQGHHLDLRLVRNQWLLIDPKIEFLMSEVNEDKTYGDFREMGQRLAEEVISFVKRKMDKASRSGNLRDIMLSFVGHSIGNIIIRAALAESMMEPYLRFLYTYVSISGPHLGYLYSSNSLFNSGLWLLKKFKGTQCIHQLTFSDDPDLQNTFLYKLCKHRTLENFRNIILISSPQDGYVPYHSARIEIAQASLWDYSKKGKVFQEMLNDCLDQIRAPSSEHRVFMRCDVNFDTSSHGRNLNSLIGRTAHIEFLESDSFARFIIWSFPDLFR